MKFAFLCMALVAVTAATEEARGVSSEAASVYAREARNVIERALDDRLVTRRSMRPAKRRHRKRKTKKVAAVSEPQMGLTSDEVNEGKTKKVVKQKVAVIEATKEVVKQKAGVIGATKEVVKQKAAVIEPQSRVSDFRTTIPKVIGTVVKVGAFVAMVYVANSEVPRN